MTLEIVSALYIFSLLVLQQLHKKSLKQLKDSYFSVIDSFTRKIQKIDEGNFKWREATKNDLMHLAHKTNRAARLSEKMADRAFNIANSAQLGVATISKALSSRPRLRTKENLAQNEHIKKKIDEMFPETEDGQLEWLKAVLSDEELNALEKAQELAAKRI
jgi:phosphate uptake regulator